MATPVAKNSKFDFFQDGHNRSLVDQDSTYDWELEEQWEDKEER